MTGRLAPLVAIAALSGALAIAASRPPSPAAPLSVIEASSLEATELVAPIRLPLDAHRRFAVRIVHRVPEGARIDVELDAHGAPMLRWPVGSSLDRIEEAVGPGSQRRIADVRGTLVTAQGPVFRAYRPLDRAGRQLFGASWLAHDTAQATRAREAFAATMRSGVGFLELEAGARPALRERSIARHGQLLACAGCHAEARAEDRSARDPSTLRRGTDRSGFHTARYVLSDSAPLETYRPIDPNAGEPFVSAHCGEAPIALTGRTTLRCPDGTVPELRFDMPSALAAGDAHARAVCSSRRALAAYLTERARHAFRSALAECEDAS